MNGISDLSDLSIEQIEAYGGKAAHLGELLKLGLPVPPGFCIGHEALRSFLPPEDKEKLIASEEAGLKDFISPYLESLDARINQESHLYAVRSSASGEDSASASFAGQFETVLAVRTPQEVCDAIIRCWNSARSSRAMSYRRIHNLSELPMSVIVQKLVVPDVAGICFTCHPVSLDLNTYVIEANWGFGDAVVAGMVSPDHVEVDATNRTVKARQLGQKRRMSVLVSGKMEMIETPRQKQDTNCLLDDDLSRIVDIARKIHEHFGCAQDIEWALAADHLFILQARPVTGLSTRNQPKEKPLYV